MDKDERTALHLATENGHGRVVDVLTEKYRANLNLRTKVMQFPPIVLLFIYCSRSFQDGSTLMHIASRSGQPMTALSFLKRGVPLHMPNKV